MERFSATENRKINGSKKRGRVKGCNPAEWWGEVDRQGTHRMVRMVQKAIQWAAVCWVEGGQQC